MNLFYLISPRVVPFIKKIETIIIMQQISERLNSAKNYTKVGANLTCKDEGRYFGDYQLK